MSHERRSEQPIDRLTRMCDAMTDVFNDHPEYQEGDKCIVFLDDGKRGGLVINGYEDDSEAIADLLQHMQAMFRAMGKKMDIMFMDEHGTDRVNG